MPALFFIVIISIQLLNSFIHFFIYFSQFEYEVPLSIGLIWFFIRNKSLSLVMNIILMNIERTPEIPNYMNRSKLQKLDMLQGENTTNIHLIMTPTSCIKLVSINFPPQYWIALPLLKFSKLFTCPFAVNQWLTKVPETN